ncbi:MAG: OadG-related small transporter subunit [Oscillospiraceae bacterium]
MIIEALRIMLFGMLGIFIVMGILIGAVKVLDKSNK